jgi:hypothetical protein
VCVCMCVCVCVYVCLCVYRFHWVEPARLATGTHPPVKSVGFLEKESHHVTV